MSTPASDPDPGSPSTLSVAQADEMAATPGTLIDAAQADDLPTSFGVFKPVGHVMIGLPTQAQLDALVAALGVAGWPGTAARQFSPLESAAELQAMADKAGALAGFGYEISLLRRYVSLTGQGYRWLLVQAGDSERAVAAAKIAQDCGATLGVYYRTLLVEDMIH